MRIINGGNLDYFNHMSARASSNFKEIPEPLEWIEPSINMLYLNTVSSFVLGNYFASILTMGVLLEHILRLAVVESEKNGLERNVSTKELDKIGTISALIVEAHKQGFISDEEKPWWNEIAKIIRNKSAHYLLPLLLRDFTREEYEGDKKVRDSYHPDYYKFTDKDGKPSDSIVHDWGSFFHKSDYFISAAFILDSTEHLKQVISRTSWKSDLSWWKSQKSEYDMFFKYSWKHNDMKASLEKYYSSR